MRIVYHHRILARDGMRVHVDALVAALRRQGHVVALAGPGESDSPGERGSGRSRTTRPRSLAAGLTRLRRALPRWLTDLLELAYNLHDYPALRRAADHRKCDAIYERYNLYLFSGRWLSQRRRLPLILEVNAPLMEERAATGALGLPRLARWAEGRIWRSADAVLPVSRQIADRVREAGVPEERILVQPNAVDRVGAPGGGPEVRRRLGLEGCTVIGFVGFLRAWHRLDRVLDILAHDQARDVRLLVIGDGPARAELEDRANALEVGGHLHITGALSHAETAPHLDAVDVAVQPDVTPYASPLKLFEYMAARRAIAAPRRSNVTDILSDGETALLFDPDDDRSFTETLLRLVADSELRARLGANAEAEVRRQGYTWDANARRVAAVVDALARGWTGPDIRAAAAQPEH
jgi:glycosyltransferase involved in cell wall biosynthesis